MKDEERRKAENDDLLQRFRAGESLAMVDAQATWWAPRPMIKKDAREVRRLYGSNVHIVRDENGR